MSYTFIDGYGSIQSADSSVVSGTVLRQSIDVASVLSTLPVTFSGSVAVTGTVIASIAGWPGTGVMGSVATLQGTNPWLVRAGGSIISVVQGSVFTVQSGTVIGSLVSTVPSSVLVGASVFGQLPGGTATLGSIAVLQGTNPFIINGSVQSFGNSSVQLLVGSAVIGSVAALQGTMPWTISSVYGNIAGSVVAFQGAGWSGSVAAFLQGNASVITVLQSPSIVGTYAEDTAHTSGDKGFLVMQVRNDTLSSITSADGDYSPFATGPVGEMVVANAPLTKWVQGTADLRVVQGASVVAIAAQGASIFTYITGVQLANLGSASVLATLCSSGSTLGYTIVPAGGGSNIVYPNALKTPANGTFAASLSGVASVLMSAQGFIAKI